MVPFIAAPSTPRYPTHRVDLSVDLAEEGPTLQGTIWSIHAGTLKGHKYQQSSSTDLDDFASSLGDTETTDSSMDGGQEDGLAGTSHAAARDDVRRATYTGDFRRARAHDPLALPAFASTSASRGALAPKEKGSAASHCSGVRDEQQLVTLVASLSGAISSEVLGARKSEGRATQLSFASFRRGGTTATGLSLDHADSGAAAACLAGKLNLAVGTDHNQSMQKFLAKATTGVSLGSEYDGTASACLAAQMNAVANLTEQPHPLVKFIPQVTECIKFIRGEELRALPTPVPRCQDLPERCFGIPSAGDIVVAISHAWRNQTHPDPCGHTLEQAAKLALRLEGDLATEHASVLFFFDFVSVPQQAFQSGQAGRTEAEAKQFATALGHMPFVYFYADATMHLSNERMKTDIPGEGDVYEVTDINQLRSATFEQVGPDIRISRTGDDDDEDASFDHGWSVDSNPRERSPQYVPALFDVVLQVGGVPPESVDSLHATLHNPAHRAPVTLERLPFGRRGARPSHTRGWIFLERFITMAKAAMLPEDVASKLVITNSSRIFKQITSGAQTLREAAHEEMKESRGDPQSSTKLQGSLLSALGEFLEELDQKGFSPVSADRATANSGAGCDRIIVAGIMRHFVEHLRSHWHHERQHMINRSKSSAVERMKQNRCTNTSPARSKTMTQRTRSMVGSLLKRPNSLGGPRLPSPSRSLTRLSAVGRSSITARLRSLSRNSTRNGGD